VARHPGEDAVAVDDGDRLPGVGELRRRRDADDATATTTVSTLVPPSSAS